MDDDKHLKSLIRHINHVKEDSYLLGEALISKGEELGLQLIANGYIHDNSKFYGVEWLYIRDETRDTKPELFASAV